MLATLITTALGRKITQPILRTIGIVIIAVSTSCMLALTDSHRLGTMFINMLHNVSAQNMENPEGSGGLLANFINKELVYYFSNFGTWIILIACFWLGAL